MINPMEIKMELMKHGVTQRQICKRFDVGENTFSGWMNQPMTENRARLIRLVIKDMTEGIEV